MPIYEYRCDDCGNTFDMLQRFSDAPVETCALCGGALRKVLHPAAIHFKGSGFYTTDYARRSSSSPSSGGGGDGGGDGGSDTSHIAGGTDDVPTFKASDKAKAENREKKAERAAKAQSEKSSSSSSKKS